MNYTTPQGRFIVRPNHFHPHPPGVHWIATDTKASAHAAACEWFTGSLSILRKALRYAEKENALLVEGIWVAEARQKRLETTRARRRFIQAKRRQLNAFFA